MRVGLNLLHVRPAIGGVWNYVARLVSALGEYNRDDEFVAFVTRESEPLVPKQANFTIVLPKVPLKSRICRVLYENTWLQIQATRHRLNCMHWFASTQALANTVPALVTVYDMHPFLNFAQFSPIKRIYLQLMVARAARRAPMLLPMSVSTASSLFTMFGVDQTRVMVVPPIISEAFRPASSGAIVRLRQEHGLPEKFWLYVAHFHEYKNHANLLRAYRSLKASGARPWPLVLRGDDRGGRHIVDRAIEQLALENDVIFVPRLAECEMPLLYSSATALVFPSLYEGGGMPVMEAMTCGCPVLASDIPTTREFACNAALVFDPSSVDSLARAMQRFHDDESLRSTCRQLGLSQAERHRPEVVYTTLMRAYKKVVSCRGTRPKVVDCR